jgi:hypothetical protein
MREWGGRWYNGHHMLHGPPNRALHVLASVNNGASLTDGNSLSPAQASYLGRRSSLVEE